MGSTQSSEESKTNSVEPWSCLCSDRRKMPLRRLSIEAVNTAIRRQNVPRSKNAESRKYMPSKIAWTHSEMSRLVEEVKSLSKRKCQPLPTRKELTECYNDGQFQNHVALEFWENIASNMPGHKGKDCYLKYRYVVESGVVLFNNRQSLPSSRVLNSTTDSSQPVYIKRSLSAP